MLRKIFPYQLTHFFCLFCFSTSFAQQHFVSGRVTDAKTGQPLSACSVYSVGFGNGATTDENGYYTFHIPAKNDSIAVSRIGYQNEARPVSGNEDHTINFALVTSSAAMQGVVISAKTNLSRAQRLIKRVIKNKPQNNVYENKNLQCSIYDKVELDVKNIPEKLQHSFLLKPLAFAFKYMDTTDDKQTFLPMYLSESNGNYYYRNNPLKEKYDYEAAKTWGNPNISILTYVDGIYKLVNIYDNNIKLVDKTFISPIANDALNFYNYNITDTLFFGSHRCIRVEFTPLHYGTYTFKGYLWITDTSYAIKSVSMEFGAAANVNWVRRFELSQNFETDPQNRIVPQKDMVYIDLSMPFMKGAGAIARKTTLFNGFTFNSNSTDSAFNQKARDRDSVNALGNDASYWSKNRLEPLTRSEAFVHTLVDTVNTIPLLAFYGNFISALSTGFYTAGKIDIGNIYNTYTSNDIEGYRYSVGFKTNKYFKKNFQFKTYLGYSTQDEKFRYAASTFFILNREHWSSLFFRYKNDIEVSNESQDLVSQNSIFAAFLQRISSNLFLLNNQSFLAEYNKFYDDGFSFLIRATTMRITPYFDVYYKYNGFTPFIYDTTAQVYYNANEVSGTIRYAFQERFFPKDFRRISLGSYYPILSLTYTKGIKINGGSLKSNFNYDRLRFTVYHDFNDFHLGRLTYTLQGGITNGVLPIVLLDVQKGNDTYYYDKYAFNNMNRYEFIADKYFSWQVQQNWGSFPFNKIPFIRKLKWRSLATFNGVFGNMSEANKTANGYYDSAASYRFTIPYKVPYMEAGVGVSNIFKIIRIDAIWRLTYLNNPNIERFGIKGSLELKF